MCTDGSALLEKVTLFQFLNQIVWTIFPIGRKSLDKFSQRITPGIGFCFPLNNGKIAMWITWDGIYSGIAKFPTVAKNYKLGVAHPPKGPANNGTIIANWGWAINKYSKNQDLAAKFIDYAASIQSEISLAKTGNMPSRTDALNDSNVQKALLSATNLVDYVKNVELHYRPITAHAQRVSDAFEQVVNKYLNNQIDLDTAVTQGKQAVDQAMQG